MPDRDWYLEQFDTTTKENTLDLSDVQTSQLSELSDRTALEYETRFIDELYGTENAHWDKGEDPTAYDITSEAEVTWGLDLVRLHDYEPSDAELEAYNDYQDPPHVVNQRMLEMKSESHGRRFV